MVDKYFGLACPFGLIQFDCESNPTHNSIDKEPSVEEEPVDTITLDSTTSVEGQHRNARVGLRRCTMQHHHTFKLIGTCSNGS